MGDDSSQPGPDFSGSGPVEYNPTEVVAEGTLEYALQQAKEELFALQGVVSVGIGYGPAGAEALIVGVVDAGVARNLPDTIGGLAVIADVIGEVDAQPD